MAAEVKKTQNELDRLIFDLLKLSAMQREVAELKAVVSTNSFKKWEGLLALKPALFWAVGPSNSSQLFSVTYAGNVISLREENLARLKCSSLHG